MEGNCKKKKKFLKSMKCILLQLDIAVCQKLEPMAYSLLKR